MGKLSFNSEFWEILKSYKNWWLTPILIAFIILIALIIFTEDTTVLTFIYSVF